jgi:hypothetical protein
MDFSERMIFMLLQDDKRRWVGQAPWRLTLFFKY